MILEPIRQRGRAVSCFAGVRERNCSNTSARTITAHRKEWSGQHSLWNARAPSSHNEESLVQIGRSLTPFLPAYDKREDMNYKKIRPPLRRPVRVGGREKVLPRNRD